MAAPEKIHLWHELTGYSRSLKGTCQDLLKRDMCPENEYCVTRIQQSIHDFREAFALLHLLRRESKLMEGLIDHDFLNRFASINFHLEICSKYPSPERLEIICELTWIFSEVVESLVFWIDHSNVILERTMLDDYINTVRRNLARVFSPVELSVFPRDKDLPILLHSGTISNLLINMMVNAIKHGGATKIELISKKKEEQAQLLVMDNGSGIHVPYSELVPGLGLLKVQERLSIMKASFEVEEHGGFLGGAAFRINLPLAERAPLDIKTEIPKMQEGRG